MPQFNNAMFLLSMSLCCSWGEDLHFWLNIPTKGQQFWTTRATACKDLGWYWSRRCNGSQKRCCHWGVCHRSLGNIFDRINLLLCWWIFKSELILANVCKAINSLKTNWWRLNVDPPPKSRIPGKLQWTLNHFHLAWPLYYLSGPSLNLSQCIDELPSCWSFNDLRWRKCCLCCHVARDYLEMDYGWLSTQLHLAIMGRTPLI